MDVSGGGVRLQADRDPSLHVIHKNLRLLRTLGVNDERIAFPLAQVESDALRQVRAAPGGEGPFALINPGAAWPNKRWPPERFGELAAFLRDVRGLPSVVLWGPAKRNWHARSLTHPPARHAWRRRRRLRIFSRCRAPRR